MPVLVHKSDRFPGLTGRKYSQQTRTIGDWDYGTLTSRGCVLDEQGHFVARPFEKFFNYDELWDAQGNPTGLCEKLKEYVFDPMLCPSLAGPWRVMDKLDGSLGIAFHWDGKWWVKTVGSFESPEAVWATGFLNEHCDVRAMQPDRTYCFEILWKGGTPHPLTHFYKKDELVLLGVVDNGTGLETNDTGLLEGIAKSIGVRLAETYQFDTLEEICSYARNLPNDKEGVVVTFASGFKVKIKGEQFLAMDKLFHSLSKRTVLDGIVHGEYGNKAGIPEELKDILDYVGFCETNWKLLWDKCKLVVSMLAGTNEERKDVYQQVARLFGNSPVVGFVMDQWAKGKPFDSAAMDRFDTKFRLHMEALEKKDGQQTTAGS